MTDDAGPGNGVRARRRRKHARAEELRDAALELFVEKGFDATRADEIAARAGISKGTLYLYYPSKEKLLQAAVASRAREALAQVRPAAERDGTRADALRRHLSDIWVQLQDEAVGSVFNLAIAEARRFPELMDVWLRDVVRPMRTSITEVVLQGMDCGEFRKMDADGVAHSLLLPMFMSCLQRQVNVAGTAAGGCLNKSFIPQHIELVLRGLVLIPGGH